MEPDKVENNQVDLSGFFNQSQKPNSPGVPLSTASTPRQTPQMTQWIISHSGGMIRKEREATIVFVIIILISAVAMFLLYKNGQSLDPAPGIDTLKNALPPVLSRWKV